MAFDPAVTLELPAGYSPEDVEEAYARRLRETDPARVAGMDRRIHDLARSCRGEVELAYRMLTTPEKVDPSEVRRVEALAAGEPDPDAPAPKSYWRALILTLMLPGAGSWYAGGRMRGLVVMGLFTAGLTWVMHAVMQDVAATGDGGPMAKLMALQTSWGANSGLMYGAFGLALADSLVAVWAHNDRLQEAAED